MATYHGDFANRITSFKVSEDEYEGAKYGYADVTFNKKDGSSYTKRVKGLSLDTIEILKSLTAPIKDTIDLSQAENDLFPEV